MRRAEIFDPYHRRIDEVIDRRRSAGLPTVLVSLQAGDIDKLDGISIWCEGARVSFGDGVFN